MIFNIYRDTLFSSALQEIKALFESVGKRSPANPTLSICSLKMQGTSAFLCFFLGDWGFFSWWIFDKNVCDSHPFWVHWTVKSTQYIPLVCLRTKTKRTRSDWKPRCVFGMVNITQEGGNATQSVRLFKPVETQTTRGSRERFICGAFSAVANYCEHTSAKWFQTLNNIIQLNSDERKRVGTALRTGRQRMQSSVTQV